MPVTAPALTAPAHAPPADGAGSPSGSDFSPGKEEREVALHVLHKRSAPLGVTCLSLARGLDSARRLDALEWLVQAFDALNLPDAQLFAAFGLLDRFAAASPAPIAAGPGAFALVLAAMLVALKVAGTNKDLERAKRLVVEVSGSTKPWASVRRAELLILRRLNFRACTPTSRDILDRLMAEVLARAPDDERDGGAIWDSEARGRCENLARFLLELGLVHDPEAVYGPGRAPLIAALAALSLALLAMGAPRRFAEALQEPLRLVDPGRAEVSAVIPEVAEAMRQRWVAEERRGVQAGGGSAVIEKWLRRVNSFGASPPGPGELRFFIPAPAPAAAPVATEAPVKEPPRSNHGSLTCRHGGNVAEGRMATSDVLAALPTPSRRGVQAASVAAPAPAEASHGAGPDSTNAGGTGASLPASSGSLSGAQSSGAAPSSSQALEAPCPQRLPAPRPTPPGAGGSSAAAPSSHPPQFSQAAASEQMRAAASENLSTWPAPQGPTGGDAQPPSPRQVAESKASGAQGPRASISAATASNGTKESTATSTAPGGAAAPAGYRSPEPLVELTHVLNMVAPWPTQGLTSNHAEKLEKPSAGASAGSSAGKPRPPSVAAELLVSSALRMHWPVDRRKATPGDAAATCREAAQVLQEAAAQLFNAAERLEGGGAAAVMKPGAASESKRRRTFGGPSPVARAASPGAGAGGPPTTTLRGSPPVRTFAGLRV